MRHGKCSSCNHVVSPSPLDALVAAVFDVGAKPTVLNHRSLADEIKSCSKDNNDIISIPTGGRPMQLLQLPSIDSPSSQADQRTLDRRSTIIANVIEAVSTKRTRSDDDKEKDMIAQIAHLIKKPKIKRYECFGTIVMIWTDLNSQVV